MISNEYLAVLDAKDQIDFGSAVVAFAQRLGFDTVSAVTVVDRGRSEADFYSVGNTPDGFDDAAHSAAESRRDPVLQYLKHHSVPLVWTRQTYVEQGEDELWEHQAAYGFHTGIAMALHMPEGRHFLLGVDRDQALPSDASELTRLVAHLQLFAVHAQDAAMRVLVPSASRPETPMLSPRELEVLRWTMEGKTAWEVGAILGISERTAVLHANNATRKLDCTNKLQAVLKAFRLGLIH